MNMLDRFRALWHVDFEYRQDSNDLPIPICMCAIEQRTGRKIEMWRDELLRCRQAPFYVGDDAVMIAYASNAELACFEALGWRHPVWVLDLYVEAIAAINGDDAVFTDDKRPSLLETLELYGLEPRMTKEEKGFWRDVILDNTDYTPDQKRGIQDYNRIDVLETLALIERMVFGIDLRRAFHRGRYMGAVARSETTGLPILRPRLDRFTDHWDDIKRHYIKRDDAFGLWDGLEFHEYRLRALVRERDWNWPLTDKGRNLALDFDTWRHQVKLHPELKSTAQLRNLISELRISALANTVGRDSRSRCSLKPFWTITGRNQPSERGKIFLPALPAWLQGIIAPPPATAWPSLISSHKRFWSWPLKPAIRQCSRTTCRLMNPLIFR
jgi:DNA polymerase I